MNPSLMQALARERVCDLASAADVRRRATTGRLGTGRPLLRFATRADPLWHRTAASVALLRAAWRPRSA